MSAEQLSVKISFFRLKIILLYCFIFLYCFKIIRLEHISLLVDLLILCLSVIVNYSDWEWNEYSPFRHKVVILQDFLE